MATKSDKDKAFQKAIENINNSFSDKHRTGKDDVVSVFGDRNVNVPTVSSGSLVLDSILGGGFPKGRVIEIFGPAGSGKTSIALTAGGNVQREGGKLAFIDLENALDPSYSQKLGVKVEEMVFSQPQHAEQALELVIRLAESEMVDMIIIDSVSALVTKAEIEGTMEDQSIGTLARLMGRALRKLVNIASATDTTIIFINQVREKVGVLYGNPETTSGGKALEFFASQRIRVSRIGQVKENGEVVGTEIKFKVLKNKVAPPFKEKTTQLNFAEGINMATELVTVGPEYGAIHKPTRVSWVDPTIEDPETGKMGWKFAKSKDDAKAKLQEDPELFQRIAGRLADILNGKAEQDISFGGEDSAEGEDEDDLGNVDKETGEIF